MTFVRDFKEAFSNFYYFTLYFVLFALLFCILFLCSFIALRLLRYFYDEYNNICGYNVEYIFRKSVLRCVCARVRVCVCHLNANSKFVGYRKLSKIA